VAIGSVDNQADRTGTVPNRLALERGGASMAAIDPYDVMTHHGKLQLAEVFRQWETGDTHAAYRAAKDFAEAIGFDAVFCPDLLPDDHPRSPMRCPDFPPEA
jgi:hypothetical protein